MAVPPPPNPTPSKGSTITLREINKANWRQVTDLRVQESQEGSVNINTLSLVESYYSEDAWVRAIYAEETVVGFLMMSLWDPEDWYAIWRFMIDQRYQGLGFGRVAVKLAIAHVRDYHPRAKLIRLRSKAPGGKQASKDIEKLGTNYSPYKFYSSLGFKDIEPTDINGEIEMGLYL